MRRTMINLVSWFMVFSTIIAIAYAGFRIERYFNWRFGYSGYVEQRLESVEQRLTALELKNATNHD